VVTVSELAGAMQISLADVAGWLLVAVLLCLLAVAALLVVVWDLGEEVARLRRRLDPVRDQRDRSQAAVAGLQVETIRLGFALGDLQGRYEQLADLHARDQLLIDEFIPNFGCSEEGQS
jgi:hypothetical protein